MPAISIEHLSKRYRLGEIRGRPTLVSEALAGAARRFVSRSARRAPPTREEILALDDVTLEIERGEAVGVIGRNGSGKSTLLKVLARITEPTGGVVRVAGRVGAIIEVGTGFHPELTGRENILLNGAILGMSRGELARKFDDIVSFSQIEDFLDTPVKRYSSGMKIRLAFSVAAHLDPEILLIDEVLAVGDAEFQRRCLGRMDEISRSGRTVLFVSHNSSAIESLCDRAVWLDGGRVVRDGPASEVTRSYLLDRARLIDPVWRPPRPSDHVDAFCREMRTAALDGAPTASFGRGDPIVVETVLEVADENPLLRVGFDVANQEGTIAFATAHVDARPEAALPAGLHLLRAVVPGHLLNSGLYSIHARLGIDGVRWIHHVDDVLQIEIRERDEPGAPPRRPGIVAPPVEWTSERVAASSRLTSV